MSATCGQFRAKNKISRNTALKQKLATSVGFYLFVCVLTFLFSGLNQALAATGINKAINYQGRLMDSSGTAVADGVYKVTFSLYTQSSGGSHIWSASTTNGLPTGSATSVNVTVKNGLFSVQLGDTGQNSLDAVDFNNDTLYLGVKVVNDSEMTPRKRLTAIPYAFNSQALQGQHASGSVATWGGSLFAINQNSANSATATRSALFIKTLGISNANDYLIRGNNGSDVFTVTRQGSVTTTGNLQVQGSTILNGSLAVAATSTLAHLKLNGRVDSNLSPFVSNAYDLGTVTYRWRNLYVASLYASGTIQGATALLGGVTTTNLYNSGVVSTTQLFVNGVAVTGDGPTPTWQQVTDAGATTNHWISFAGATSTSDFRPLTDNAYSLGLANFRWKGVFALGVTTTWLGATTVSTTNLFVNGQSVTSSVPTLNQVANKGNVTAKDIQFGGGTSTKSFKVSDHFTVTGNSTLAGVSSTMMDAIRYVSTTNLYIHDLATVGGLRITGNYPFMDGGGYSTVFESVIPDQTYWNMAETNLSAYGGAGASYTSYVADDGSYLFSEASSSRYVFAHVPPDGINGSTTWFGYELSPMTDNLQDLGRPSYRWRNLLAMNGDFLGMVTTTNLFASGYVSTTNLYVNGIQYTGGGLSGSGTDNHLTRWNGTSAVQDSNVVLLDDGTVLPTSTLIQDLGSSDYRWRDVWASSTRIGTSTWELWQANEGFTISRGLGNRHVTIGNTGKVGVGINTPEEALDVKGNIQNVLHLNQDFPTIASTTMTATPTGGRKVGKYLYIAASGGSQLMIFDVSNPKAPVELSSNDFSFTGVTDRPAVIGDYLFLPTSYSSELMTIDISDPVSPTLLNTYTSLFSIQDVEPYGNHLLVADSGNTRLVVLDVTNPANPTETATLTTGSYPMGLDVQGGYAYTANNGDGTMSIIDVSNLTAPTLATTTLLSVGYSPRDLKTLGNYVFVVGANGPGDGEMVVVDVTNPTNPVVVSDQILLSGEGISKISISGRYAYLVDNGSARITVMDIADPTSPVLIQSISGNGYSEAVVDGHYVYAPDYAGALNVIDIHGTETNGLMAHSAEMGSLTVLNDANFSGQVIAQSGVVAGSGGILSLGALGAYGTSTFTDIKLFGRTDSDVLPFFTKTYSLGSSAYIWKDLFAISVSSTNIDATGYVSTSKLYVNGAQITGGGSQDLQAVTDAGNVTTNWMDFAGGTSTEDFFVGLNNDTNGRRQVNVSNLDSSGEAAAILQNDTGEAGIILPGSFAGGQGANRLLVRSDSSLSGIRIEALGLTSDIVLKNGNGEWVRLDSEGVLRSYGTSTVGLFLSAPATGKLTVKGNGTGSGYAFAALDSNDAVNFTIQDSGWTAFKGATSTGDVMPSADDAHSLGGAKYRWKNLFVSSVSSTDIYNTGTVSTTNLYVNGTQITGGGSQDLQAVTDVGAYTTNAIQFGGGTSTGSFRPNLNNNLDLGSPANSWSNVYASGTAALANVSSLINGSSLTEISAVDLGWGTNGVRLAVAGNYAYICTNGALYIYDVTLRSSPTYVGSYAFVGNGYGISVQGRFAYVGTGGGNTMLILDVSNPSAPTLAGSVNYGSEVRSVKVSGKYAYVSNYGSNLLRIVDVGNPYAPYTISSLAINKIYSTYVQGRYAYVANENGNTLTVVDLNDINDPKVVGSVAVGSWAQDVYVQGSYAYVTNYSSDSVSIVDVSDPTSPSVVATFALQAWDGPCDIVVSGRYAYVSAYDSASLLVLDVGNPANPILVARTAGSWASGAWGLDVQGQNVFMTSWGGYELMVFDTSGIETSNLLAHSAEVGDLRVSTNLNVANQASVQGGLNVGQGGIFSIGSLAVGATNTTSTFQYAVSSSQALVSRLFTSNGNTVLGNSASDIVTYNARAASDFSPSADGTYSLGLSGMRWKNLYASNVSSTNIDALGYVSTTALFVNGTQITGAISVPSWQQVTDVGATTSHWISFAGASSSGNIVPTSTLAYDLGSLSFKWKSGYLGDLTLGTSTDWLLTQNGISDLSFQNQGINVLSLNIGGGDDALATLKPTTYTGLGKYSVSDSQNNESAYFSYDTFSKLTKVWTATSSDIQFGTDDTARMQLDTAGTLTLLGTSNTSQLIIKAHGPQSNSHPLIKLVGSGGWNLTSLSSDNQRNLFMGTSAGENNDCTSGGLNNYFVGYYSGNGNTMGTRNIGLGSNSLRNNSDGNDNIGIGNNALSTLNGGIYNIGLGNEVMHSRKAGLYNVAVGQNAMYSDIEGSYNTAIGGSALNDLATSTENVAVGYSAGSGYFVGTHEIQYGVFVGKESGSNLITGANNNTMIGYQSGYNNSSGANNAFLGYKSGYTVTTGASNTFIGALADTTLNSVNNSMALGAGASVTSSNIVRVGNSAIASIGGYRPWSNLSDIRLKRDIQDSDIGLDFVRLLQTKTFKMGASDDVRDGFIAQEVKSAMDTLGTGFSGLDDHEVADGGYYYLDYSSFVLPLTNAVKTLDIRTDKLAQGVGLDNGFATGTKFLNVDAVGNVALTSITVAKLGESTSSTQGYDSGMFTLQGSGWDTVSSTAVTTNFKIFNRTINATTSELVIGYSTGTNEVSNFEVRISNLGDMNVAGDVTVGKRLFLGNKTTGVGSTSTYIFVDDTLAPTSTYIATNADGWQASTAYDYAERYVSDDALEPGDVVTVDQNGINKVRLANSGDPLLGIVSTKPGFITGAHQTSTYPIALAGRVPTKVSTANGAIRAGDYLTVSAQGVAIKATESGEVVGLALESYDKVEAGLISVFVKPQQITVYGPENITAQSNQTRTGLAKVLAGSNSVKVNFQSLGAFPVVSVTPYGQTSGYWIEQVTDTSFTLVLSQPVTYDLTVGYFVSLPTESTISVSDNTQTTLDTVTGQEVSDVQQITDEVSSEIISTDSTSPDIQTPTSGDVETASSTELQ